MCKTVLRSIVVVLIITLISGIVGCKKEDPSGTNEFATVKGRVILPEVTEDDFYDPEMLEHAVVYLGGRYVVTGADDTFQFDNVPVGTHEILVYDGCYQSEVQKITVTKQGLADVIIEPYLSYAYPGGINDLTTNTQDLCVGVLVSEELDGYSPVVTLSYLKDGKYVDLGYASFLDAYVVDVTDVLEAGNEYTVLFTVRWSYGERRFKRTIHFAENQLELLEPVQPEPGAVIPITDSTPFFNWIPVSDNETYELVLLTPDYALVERVAGLTEPQYQFPDEAALTAGEYRLWIMAYQKDNAGHVIEAYQLEAILELPME
mgnify:FL=1